MIRNFTHGSHIRVLNEENKIWIQKPLIQSEHFLEWQKSPILARDRQQRTPRSHRWWYGCHCRGRNSRTIARKIQTTKASSVYWQNLVNIMIRTSHDSDYSTYCAYASALQFSNIHSLNQWQINQHAKLPMNTTQVFDQPKHQTSVARLHSFRFTLIPNYVHCKNKLLSNMYKKRSVHNLDE